jgi:hypothetical protein
MRVVGGIVLLAAVAIGVTSSANARGGCGEGWHRGPGGGCLRNGGADVVVAPGGGPGIGVFVAGRGYWDGHRYWARHEMWRGHWRFR